MYVGGRSGYRPSTGIIWKNGVGTNTPSGVRSVNDLFLSGRDVYAAVYSSPSALYLKNNVIVPIPDSLKQDFQGSEITGLGKDDIYVAGTYNNTSDAVYYHNKQKFTLTKGSFKMAEAISIAIKPR